jgi:hypothetical protein
MKHFNLRTPTAYGVALPLMLALAACGGGGDSAPAAPPAPTALSLSGTVATGAAMVGATVAVSCASGTGTATTSASGGYTVTVTGGSLPCVLTATSADGATVLHSVAADAASRTVTSNITPLSELLVAQLAGTDPATFASSFNSSTTITSASVQAAQTAVLQVLTAAGLDTSAVSDIVSGNLVAGSGAGYDGVLDNLKVVIASAGSSLNELTTAVATSSSAGSTTSASTVTSLLAASSTDCPALKSGAHRVIDLSTNTTRIATIDAAALTVAVDGGSHALAKTGSTSCDYTLNDADSTRVLVTRSGMAVWRQGNGSTGAIGISLPVQALDIASLAGVYNRVSYSGGAHDSGDFGTVTFNAAGANTTSMNCDAGYGSCTEDANPQGHLAVNADGGFDYIDDGAGAAVAARIFGFRNPAGKTLLLALEADGRVSVFSPQAAQTVPQVGGVNAFWQFTVNGTGIGTVSEESVTVSAADSTAGSFTRQFASDSHVDTVSLNAPFSGMRYRAQNACATSTGAAMSCNGTVQLPLPGTGITLAVSSVSTRHFMTVSIGKP